MKKLLTVFYFGIILLLSIVFYFKPDYNWDVLPYMALSMEPSSPDFKAVHSEVYRLVKAELPKHKYDALVDSSSAYRRITAADPVVFQNELGFYRTRPLYVWMIRLFHWVGFPLTKATILPSILAFFVIGLLLYFLIIETHSIKWGFLKSFFSPQRRRDAENNSEFKMQNAKLYSVINPEIKRIAISMVFCLAIMISPFMVNAARLSTPDMLTALFLLSGSWILLNKRTVFAVSVLFLLALLTRYDCFLYIFIMLIWLFIRERQRIVRWWALIAGMIFITIFQFHDILFILKHVFSIMPSSDRLAGSPGSGLFTGFIKSIVNGFPSFFHSQVALISFIFLADIILRRVILHTGWKDPSLLFSLCVYAYIPVRYLMHPAIDDRFLVASYVLILLFFLRTLNRVLEVEMLDHQRETPAG
jgi:hypothetical protein